ncbi:MAG: YcxB family protein [Lachnospiraceae bacterium]|nr:YcxB family protein [Lachnospiraceae bacterium]
MEYSYRYRIKPSDLWQVRMYYAYASYLATVNIICIFASIVLIIVFWKNAEPWVRLLLLLFLSLFTVIQPLFIYHDCKKQLKGKEDEIQLLFKDPGFTIKAQGKSETHPYGDILSFTVRPTLVIIYTGNSQGYILTNRVLGSTRKGFISFVNEKRGKIRV